MLKREEIARIKEMYPKGTPIRLYSMEGEQSVPPGSRGVVDHVDDIGQIHMKWENGSSLALNVEEDRFDIITLIPLEMRQKAEMEKGDILKVSINSGKIVISKVDILEVGKQDEEAVEAYVHAAVKTMSHEKQVALAARILKLAQQEGGTDC